MENNGTIKLAIKLRIVLAMLLASLLSGGAAGYFGKDKAIDDRLAQIESSIKLIEFRLDLVDRWKEKHEVEIKDATKMIIDEIHKFKNERN